jgi:hypothetical protein
MPESESPPCIPTLVAGPFAVASVTRKPCVSRNPIAAYTISGVTSSPPMISIYGCI